MTDDPGSPESLSPARRELLRRRLAQQQEKQRPPSGPVRGEAGSGPQPLSFAQERFWFLEQLEPGSPDYTITVPGIICGLLQVDLLRLALNDMVQRHPALRMCFPARDGVPSQQLAEAGKVELPLIVREDLGAESLRSQRDLATADYAQEQHKRGFDLGTGPLFRATVVRFSDAAHAFIVSLHHIIADGWSLSVMMTDLTAFYNGRRRGVAALLPEPAVSYADWAHWQRKRLSGEPLAQLLGHWRGVLDGAPMHLELPHDLARPPTPGHTGATQHYPLPAELITQLRARAAELNTTPFVTLLAAFKAYCLRITGETDLVLGTSIANRDHVHLSQVVGPCLNTLALRTVASNEQTFAEFVTAVRSTVHGALSRPELPFEKLVDALQPVRDPSRSPIFNVFFDMVVPLPEPHWDGLDSYSIDFERGTALFDLSLSVEDRGHSMLCALQFNTELFLPQTAERLWHHFTVLLGSALKDPQQTLGELELLDGGDKEQLQQWAEASQLDHDRSAWVHRQIAAQAQTTPDAAALIEDGRVTTYGELDRAANAFAWRLTGMGAGPDVLIAVCLPRSSCVLQTLLGIWKAGAAYLPLSPDDPHERLAVIVDDTQPAVIVTLSTLAERFAGLSCQLLFVDQPGDECTSTTENAQRAAPPSPETSADDLAYVIFTSGSTGEPKGVMISHAALTNHIAWVRDAFDISASDRFVLRTPFTFDASIWEIVHPLVSGASLIIAAPGLQRDPAGLLKLVATEQVTVMQTVPSMLRSWLDEPRFSEVTSLRHLICAGEALLPDLVARFDERCLAAGLPTQLHNLYGPSEATIDSTMHSCQRGTGEIAQGREAVPIGRPISNTVVHVLDASRQLLPVGVVGELVIAGEGLAKGYLHRPDLTRERFVDNPLGKGKVYLSGDLGRRLPDGSLEYVGRIDSQVKVNGHRIELGEVEAVLCEHPDVGEAAVIADGQSGEQRRLLAYYVPRQSCSPTTTDLRKFVETRLPRYMIPAAFLSLPTLPRTSSEKLDRRALPRPEALRPDLAEQFAAPVTATEQTITQIMVELLELDRVGLHDDFFALGGHSLLATKLSSRIRQNLGVEMPLMDFFECPTVAALATVVDGSQSHDDRQIQPAPDQPDHPVSFGQQRLWFLSQLEPEATHYHMTGAMGLAGPLNVDALQAALDALVARHDALHTALRWRSGELRQVVLAPAPVALLLVDQSHHASTAEQDAAVHTELDALGQEAFDLSTAPLLRGRLITLGQDNHVLALCQHHIVSDGRSLQLLLSELGQLYRAACSGEAHQLPPLAIGTVDHAHWQRSRLDEQRLRSELSWWQQTLQGAPGQLDLPTDHSRPPAPSHRGHVTSVALSSELTANLRRLAKEQETTLFVVLAATMGAWLSRLTGQRDMVLGTAVDQRTATELEPLLGFFVNVLPLRLNLSAAPTFEQLIQRLRHTVTSALSHRELPFEHLVDKLAPERDQSRSPLFNVSFDLISGGTIDDVMPGLQVSAIDYDPGTAKLDLAVAMEAQGDRLQVWIEASADLFEKDTVQRLWHHWEVLTTELLSRPQQSIERAQMLTTEERTWLLRDCQPAKLPDGDTRCALQRLITLAHERPDETALIWQAHTVSYSAFVERVREIAGQLATGGVVHGDLVALCLPRSPDQLASQLACWWLGAAWLPLDVSDPPLRQQQLLRAARPQLLLCHKPSATGSGAADRRPHKLAQLILDSAQPGNHDGALASAPLAQDSPAEQRAYVLFTSGSTGAPKGVEVSHGALTGVLSALHEQFQLNAQDRCVQRIPWTFDASLQELLLPFWAGCPLVIAESPVMGDPDASARLIEAQGITAVLGVPSFIGPLIDRLSPEQNGLRLVGCGGEALPPSLLAKLSSRVQPGAALFNLYGPTEATITALSQRYTVQTREIGPYAMHAEQASLPIGRPLPGTQAHVVDEQLRLLPMGLIGELCLAGPSLANGYIYDGATTAAAFVPNPFDDGVHARLYRTGDLVRRQVDGSLVFVGRADTQVKVAGQRMELNEIEALLASHPLVNQCAVSTAGQTPASLRLIAWVAIGDEQATLDGLSTPASRPSSTHASSLRQWLAERLPQAMVPRTFELLPTLPRTSTGKIDRPALQARLNSQQEATVSSSPLVSTRDSPQPADEHAAALLRAEISALFERLLGPGAAAPDADFFASGGHSLLAIELAEHLSSLTGQTVPVQTVFERRTAAALANVLHRRSLGQDAPLLEEIDLFAEVQLDSCVQPGQRRAAQPAAEVLLTGATGFLGAHLLIDLLQHTEARVHCLVRAADATLAAQRITRNLRSYELAVSPDQSARIVALPGDLAAEHLGLDTVSYEGLASSLDLVLHNGAAVDFLQGYRALEGTNVQGTKSVLQLCARAGAAVHFVSTLGVLTSPNLAQRQSLNEDLPMADLVDVEGGYEQTKWVAEMLVHEAGSRGLPVAIYRPGRIAGNSRTGCWAADDVARRFMVGTAHLGSWPELDAPIDLSPVDWVSGSIVHLALAGAAHGETYHLVHPQPSPIELFASAAERLGYTFDRVSPDEWQRRAISAAEHDNAHPLHLMLPLLPKIEGRPITADELVPEATMPPIGSDFTQRALRNASTCPTVDLALVERWLTKMLPPHQSTTTESSL